jgi:hypothetical protein
MRESRITFRLSGETELPTDVHVAAIQEHDRANELQNRNTRQLLSAVWDGVQLIRISLFKKYQFKDNGNLRMATLLKHRMYM